VAFVGSGPDQPTSSQSPLTWVLSNNYQVIDLFFFTDPVAIGETGTFAVHIDNPDEAVHSVGFFPTPIPEPGTLMIIGTGSLVTLGFRRFWMKRKST
jgi:hypothetical protein